MDKGFHGQEHHPVDPDRNNQLNIILDVVMSSMTAGRSKIKVRETFILCFSFQVVGTEMSPSY